MNQKQLKAKQLLKLKAQAEILFKAAEAQEDTSLKREQTIKAALILTHHYCPERTKLFKESIRLCEQSRHFKTAYSLASIALLKKDEIDYFLSVYEKYSGRENEAA